MLKNIKNQTIFNNKNTSLLSGDHGSLTVLHNCSVIGEQLPNNHPQGAVVNGENALPWIAVVGRVCRITRDLGVLIADN